MESYEQEWDDEPMDMTDPQNYAGALNRLHNWCNIHDPRHLPSLQSLAFYAQNSMRLFNIKAFELFPSFLDYAKAAQDGWERPSQVYGLNAHFLIELQEWLKDYQQNCTRLTGSDRTKTAKKINMVKAIFPKLLNFQRLNWAPIHQCLMIIKCLKTKCIATN